MSVTRRGFVQLLAGLTAGLAAGFAGLFALRPAGRTRVAPPPAREWWDYETEVTNHSDGSSTWIARGRERGPMPPPGTPIPTLQPPAPGYTRQSVTATASPDGYTWVDTHVRPSPTPLRRF